MDKNTDEIRRLVAVGIGIFLVVVLVVVLMNTGVNFS